MPEARGDMKQQVVKRRGSRVSAGGVRQRYNTTKRKKDKEEAELGDLLVDPQYDPLFEIGGSR
jgi:hypothetical protein